MTRHLLTPASAALSLCLLASGCLLTEQDHYARVEADCSYLHAGGTGLSFKDEEIRSTTLTEECREALLSVIPINHKSFENAPEGTLDKVLEAFQVLVAYPLALPPEGRILGTAPYSIPISHLDIFFPGSPDTDCYYDRECSEGVNYAKNIFNYVVNQIDQVKYFDDHDGSADGDAARYHPVVKDRLKRTVWIFPAFWEPEFLSDWYRTPFVRASTLVHEARHGDEIWHDRCPDDGAFSCDRDLHGPYGLQTVYLVSLIHGSATRTTEAGEPVLSNHDLNQIGRNVCDRLKEHVLGMPGELEVLIEGVGCGYVNAKWVLEREGVLN